MPRWSVSVFVLGSVVAGASCGGESVIGNGTGGFGGDLLASGGVGGDLVLSGGVGGAAGIGGGVTVGGTGGGYAGGYSCDIQVALSKSCARTGCHSALDHYADLDLSNPAAIAAQMVNQPAQHGDINCAQPGTPFQECAPYELPYTCPPNALLIDGVNFDNSWVVRKLNGDESCGDAMPLPPGDSVSNGWNAARKSCLIDFFRSLAGIDGGTGGAAGATGFGGAAGVYSAAGIGGGAGAYGTSGIGGAAGIGGTAGTGFDGYTPLCDLQQAFKSSCAATGCHGAIDHSGGLDLSNVGAIAAQVVDQPAMHLDISCNEPGTQYRACTTEELAPRCMGSAAVSTYFVDTQNPENSWMLKKLRGDVGECGEPMPMPPGNSSSRGWSEDRRLCIEDFVYYLAGQR